MKVKFCDADGGEVLYEKEETNIQSLMSMLNTNAEINIHRSKDDYYLCDYSSHLINIDLSDEGNPKEELLVYLDVKTTP